MGFARLSSANIGTSGWSYEHWAGHFYPPGLPAAKRREANITHFDTVELNARFYRRPREQTFTGWNATLPPGFTMSVKAPRSLTHAKRLRDRGSWIQRLERAWHELRGVLLVQLHPAHKRDDLVLEQFLSALPDWMRVAVEFRHASWHQDVVFEILRRHSAAYTVMSGAGLPCVLLATTSFV